MSDHDQTDRFDPRVRELTYRLMEMAPDAPPFPEEATTMKVPETKQRQPMVVWAAAVAAVVLLVGLPLFLFRGGDGATDPATTIAAPDTTTTTQPGEPTTTVPGTTQPGGDIEYIVESRVYLFSESQVSSLVDPALVAVTIPSAHVAIGADAEQVERDRNDPSQVVVTALDALFNPRELPSGYSSSVPELDSW
ncbi:MAG: hypothetical protein QNL12_10625, partial [Acidimicrobiia bacterium]|nr:hypothetical protein [Acidimicrobiia bacterium]MDX2467759.1 hypothetical protein [Acidimicrobiia bacterium]